MTNRPNILILCIDQWDTHMELPGGVALPALERLQSRGVTFDRQYCTVPICTPSRATMWTGQHAKQVGMWDNTNFAWITSGRLSPETPTLGTMLREQGYYTAFKGKWHLSESRKSEMMLEEYGFADYQPWGDMFGTPLQGEMLDGTVAMETVDWLETKVPTLDQPWLLVSSMVNPHDIMYFHSDEEAELGHLPPSLRARMTKAQNLGFFEDWNPALPTNFDDDLTWQPDAVRAFKANIVMEYGAPPDDREDLWRARRNYLINCMRLVDRECQKILDALDRQDLWNDTVVIFTGDHGEMNGAHRMHQKGGIHFDEAAVVNLTVVAPDGARGERSPAVGSQLDLVPTVLDFAGLDDATRRQRYPQLAGRSLRDVVLNPDESGPRGSVAAPGDGALFTWDGLNMLDPVWNVTGALSALTNLPTDEPGKIAALGAVGRRNGPPDFDRRAFFRAVVDGRYKLVRWFSPREYASPQTVDDLYARSDVTLHDLVNDPGEMENIGNPDHPAYDPELIGRMLQKLNVLLRTELGSDTCPFDMGMFDVR